MHWLQLHIASISCQKDLSLKLTHSKKSYWCKVEILKLILPKDLIIGQNEEFTMYMLPNVFEVNNNKYNHKLPHIYVMTKWMTNNYFLSKNLYIWLSFPRSHSQSKIYM